MSQSILKFLNIQRRDFDTKEKNVKRRRPPVETAEQLIIDAGQKLIETKCCGECGMVYSPLVSIDTQMHSKHHDRLLNALRLNRSSWKTVLPCQYVDEPPLIGAIYEFRAQTGSAAIRSRVSELCELIDEKLGCSGFEERRPRCDEENEPLHKRQRNEEPAAAAAATVFDGDRVVYLYVSTGERLWKIVGLCLCEQLSSAYRILASSNNSSGSAAVLVDSDGECCKAELGVSRIWVWQPMRRKQVASRLVDAARCNFYLGGVVARDQVAFSDPTVEGRTFAARYTGASNFLVYRPT